MNLTANQIPVSALATVEALHAWSGLLLQRANATLQVIESPGVTDFVTQVSVYQADDGTQRMVIRTSLELDPDWRTNGLKLWQSTREFSEVAIPAGYAA